MLGVINFFDAVATEQIAVPTWQVMAILSIMVICILLRGSSFSLLVTYIFTLHIAWSFLKTQFGFIPLTIIGVFAGLVLMLGFISFFTDKSK